MPNLPDNTSEVRGPFSTPLTFTRVTLAAPLSVAAVFETETQGLTVSFQLVVGATSYALSVKDKYGAEKVVGSAAASPIVVAAHDLQLGTAYSITVRALATGITGAWSPPVELTPKSLTAPIVSGVTNDAEIVTVMFAPVAGANAYTAEVLDAAGHPLNQPLTVSRSASPIQIPATALTSGQSYQVRVRADIITPPPAT